MKKMRWFGKFCCAFATMALASLSMVGCDLEVDDKDNRVSEAGYAPVSLEVSGQTTAFTVGDSFTLGSGVVTATYADSTTDSPHTADVTSDVVQRGFDSSKVADSLPVTLSYTKAGVTVKTEYNVKITNVIKSIALKTGDSLYSFAPNGKDYSVYGKSQAKMTVTFVDDSTDDVDATNAKFSDVTATSATMTYSGKTATVALTKKTISELWSLASVSELTTLGTIETTGTGTVADPYILSSGSAAIDCYANQPTKDTFNVAGPIDWSNPLSGKTLSGFTLSADVYMTKGAQYDALLAFYISGNTDAGGFLSIFENGNIRSNSTAGFFESIGNTDDASTGALTVPATTWTKVAVTVGTDGTVTYYKNGTAMDTSTITGYTGGGNVTWDGLNTYLTSTATNVGIGVGCSWWNSGFVGEKNYLANIKVYSTALTAEQVAALE